MSTRNAMKIIALPVLAAMCLLSCGAGGNQKHEQVNNDSSNAKQTTEFDTTLPKGRLTDSLMCRKQNGNSYALYLPSYYSSKHSFPCIFFFDAHARGALPLQLYKDLAEKYGFVLVGSNVSKNGMPWETTREVIKILREDISARINTYPHRIYTSGFSGGSKVASSEAIYTGGIAGVIGCAAGFPQVEQGIRQKFDYFGMVGKYDFNLQEMEMLDKTLEQNGFTRQILTYDGKHDWPPAPEMNTALLWIQVNYLKRNADRKNEGLMSDTLIRVLKTDYETRIGAAARSGDAVTKYELMTGMTRALEGLTDLMAYKNELTRLTASPTYKNALAQQAALQQAELNLQQETAGKFATLGEEAWAKKIAELNLKIHSSKTPSEGQMYQRLLNFTGLVAYLNSDHAIKTGDLANAATYLKIFRMADPKNPDCAYLAAGYYMKKGDKTNAIASLKESAALGYSDLQQLITDPAFNGLRNDEVYKQVVQQVSGNNAPRVKQK